MGSQSNQENVEPDIPGSEPGYIKALEDGNTMGTGPEGANPAQGRPNPFVNMAGASNTQNVYPHVAGAVPGHVEAYQRMAFGGTPPQGAPTTTEGDENPPGMPKGGAAREPQFGLPPMANTGEW